MCDYHNPFGCEMKSHALKEENEENEIKSSKCMKIL
jgi:hypothetical protein